MITSFLGRYTRFVLRHRLSVLVVVAIATAVLTRATTTLHVEINPDRLFPQAHPYIQTLNDVHRVFGDRNLVVIGLFPHDGNVFTPEFLRKIDDITKRLEKIPAVNPALIYSLASPSVRYIHGTADGIDIEPLMDEPPRDAAGAEAVKRRVLSNSDYVGTLVAADGSVAGIQASFGMTPETPDYLSLYRTVCAALDGATDGTFDYAVSGPVAYAARMTIHTTRMAFFFPLAVLMVGLVHYHAFRTLQGLILPLVTALLSVLWAVGFMGLWGIPFDPYNISTPILILAIAAGHAVQVLKRFYEEYERCGTVDEAIVAALGRVGPVMLAAGSVTALSFCSLATFQLATIRTFGLLTGFGVVSALVIELTVIPAVRSLLPPPQGRERAREAAAHPWLDRFLLACSHCATGAGGPWVLIGAVATAAVAVWFATRITVDMSYIRALGNRDPVRIGDARINAHLAGTSTLVLMIEGAQAGALEEPAILAAITSLERTLEAEPGVGKVFSYADVVSRIHREMTTGDPTAENLPTSRPLIAQYLFLYSPSGESLDALLDPTHRQGKVRILSREDSTRYADELIERVTHIVSTTFPPGYTVRFAGSLGSVSAATETMVDGKIRNIAQVTAIVFGISSLLLRSFIGGLLATAPLVLTVLIHFGVMGLIGLSLDSNTVTIAAMVVGIGADYAIYFLFRLREELGRSVDLETALQRALMTSGKAVLFVSSAVAAGYVVLCLSGFSVYLWLGSLAGLAMLVSAGSALVLLPVLVVRLRPKFLFENNSASSRQVALSHVVRS